MEHNRRGDQKSNRKMQQADDESTRAAERLRNQDPDHDRGSSSDRAMLIDRDSAEQRDSTKSSSPRGRGPASSERGRNAGGISNRELGQEESELEQLPQRRHSRSEG